MTARWIQRGSSRHDSGVTPKRDSTAQSGALVIGFIQAFNEGLRHHTPGPNWTESIVFSILILILVFRPEGLLGERTAEGA